MSRGVSSNRQTIMTIIRRLVTSALAGNTPSIAVIDAMIYGSKFGNVDVCGVEMPNGADTMAMTVRMGQHICDVLVTLRFFDPRISVFFPNALMAQIEDDLNDAVKVLAGESAEAGERDPLMLQRGFDAYPGGPGAPTIAIKRHEHGLLLGFCFGADIGAILNEGLSDADKVDRAADVMGYACLHIIHTIAAYVQQIEAKRRIQQGKAHVIEFTHPASSTEIIRNYGLNPTWLEVKREADESEEGLYALHYQEEDMKSLELFFLEIVGPKKIEAS
jgi:hypothetical protein